MALITWDDKVSVIVNPLPDENKVTDSDMNEIKSVVNANAAITGLTAWNKSTNLFPSGSIQWQMYYGTGATTRVDRSGNVLTSDPIIAIALVANASTTDPTQWAFIFTIG